MVPLYTQKPLNLRPPPPESTSEKRSHTASVPVPRASWTRTHSERPEGQRWVPYTLTSLCHGESHRNLPRGVTETAVALSQISCLKKTEKQAFAKFKATTHQGEHTPVKYCAG
uniref:Bm11757 n=1 Tax=Brugia malayi TaxID=6279 RepID=A0A1I9GA77_BRUMA|nr:Bm11757 [Brugia malayi]